MKINFSAVRVTVGASMFLIGIFVLAAVASEMDSRIEASAQKSYVYKTYLKDDAVAVKSRDGVVTLTGTVTEESHKSLAKETVANLPGVLRVDDQLVLKGDLPAENSDSWIGVTLRGGSLVPGSKRSRGRICQRCWRGQGCQE